jgi:hypothetical protein
VAGEVWRDRSTALKRSGKEGVLYLPVAFAEALAIFTGRLDA